MKRRTLPVAAAFARLPLAACEGGSEGDRSGSGDELADTRPADMDLVFDWDKPRNGYEAAATADAANFFRAIYRGVDKRTTKDPAVTTYAIGEGPNYAKTQIDAWIDGGRTATGALLHYGAVMVRASTSADLWRASKVFVDTKAAKCR